MDCMKYLLIVRLPSTDIRPLRALLKRLWRSLGIKCLELRPVGADDAK